MLNLSYDVSEYLGTLGLVKSYFFKFFGGKMKKIEEKKYLGDPTPPEDEVICLFAGLLADPDMVLSPVDLNRILCIPEPFPEYLHLYILCIPYKIDLC